MPNTSASGGYLTPDVSPAPLEGQAFEDFLWGIIVGISTLAEDMVRPRWQIDPANLPAFGTNWASFGVMDWDADTYAVTKHDPTGEGSDSLERYETDTILVSFYGPDASKYMAIFRDGLQIAQNREVLQLAKMGEQETTTARNVPVLIKDKWQQRIDIQWIIRRQILRTYTVFNIGSMNGTLYTDVTPQITASINAAP